jgi:hypothetical protein
MMEVIPLLVLAGGSAAAQAFAAAPAPQDPMPPVANTHGYLYGAQADGSTVSAPSAKPEGKNRPIGESDQLGPHDCRTLSDGFQVCTPAHGHGKVPKVSPGELALTRWAQMPIPAPAVRTAPPRRTDGLVGLPEWFWVTNWRPLSGRAAARGVWVRVTARPQSMAIDPGYGERIVHCAGPGTAYDRSRPAASQHTTCSYTFSQSSLHQPGHAYRVRVTVVWSGTWVGSDGTSGALPPVSRSTTFRLRVAEAQGLYG